MLRKCTAHWNYLFKLRTKEQSSVQLSQKQKHIDEVCVFSCALEYLLPLLYILGGEVGFGFCLLFHNLFPPLVQLMSPLLIVAYIKMQKTLENMAAAEEQMRARFVRAFCYELLKSLQSCWMTLAYSHRNDQAHLQARLQQLEQENNDLKNELSAFDPEFFEEIETLKYEYQRAKEDIIKLRAQLAAVKNNLSK